jgi:predicted thioesterase
VRPVCKIGTIFPGARDVKKMTDSVHFLAFGWIITYNYQLMLSCLYNNLPNVIVTGVLIVLVHGMCTVSGYVMLIGIQIRTIVGRPS